MNPDEHHENQAELPAPKQRVKPNRGEERAGKPEYLQQHGGVLEIQKKQKHAFELGEQRADRYQDRADPLCAALLLLLRVRIRRQILAFGYVETLVIVALRPPGSVLVHTVIFGRELRGTLLCVPRLAPACDESASA